MQQHSPENVNLPQQFGEHPLASIKTLTQFKSIQNFKIETPASSKRLNKEKEGIAQSK